MSLKSFPATTSTLNILHKDRILTKNLTHIALLFIFSILCQWLKVTPLVHLCMSFCLHTAFDFPPACSCHQFNHGMPSPEAQALHSWNTL